LEPSSGSGTGKPDLAFGSCEILARQQEALVFFLQTLHPRHSKERRGSFCGLAVRDNVVPEKAFSA
jgi:hypothetical protein